MSATLTNLAARGGIFEKIVHALDVSAEATAKRRVYRQTLRELNALSAREMADLGLNRSMIRSVAYEAAYGAK